MRHILFICITIFIFQLSFAQETWEEKAPFDGLKREGAVAFPLNGKVYAGLGWTDEFNSAADFKMYDPATNVWAAAAEFPGMPRFHSIFFVLNDRGFVVSGRGNGPDDYYQDVWEYNPNIDEWSQKADFPGGARSGSGTFVIDGKAYIVGGYIHDVGFSKETWEYDPVIDEWSQKTDLPGAGRTKMMSFAINEKGYVGLGGEFFGPFQNDLYEYDPLTDSWTQKADFPLEGMGLMADFVINDLAYLVTGMIGQNYFTDFVYTYNPATDEWESKEFFTGAILHHSTGFSIDQKGYLIFGHGITGFINNFWEYTPDGISSTKNEHEDILISVFPNPSTGIINILSAKKANEIAVFDSIGKQHLFFSGEDISNSQFQLDLTSLGKGIYFIKMNFEDHFAVKRVILEK